MGHSDGLGGAFQHFLELQPLRMLSQIILLFYWLKFRLWQNLIKTGLEPRFECVSGICLNWEDLI